MKTARIIFLIMVLMASCFGASAQSKAFEVFSPIGKYLSKGDADALSAWFADNLQISVISQESTASKAQAKQIIKSFFESHSPRSFSLTHTAGRSNMKYALGVLNAGGEMFNVTIFVTFKGGTYKIQQLSIERS